LIGQGDSGLFKLSPWGYKWPLPKGLNLYIVIYREIFKKSSSQELLHQMGEYLAWSIPRTRTFKVVQMKSLGSQMALPQGLNFYIVIYREILKKSSSRELLHQMGQYLA